MADHWLLSNRELGSLSHQFISISPSIHPSIHSPALRWPKLSYLMSLIPRCRSTLRMFCVLSDQSSHFILRKRWNHHLFPFGTLELSLAPGRNTLTHTHGQNIHRLLHCYSSSEIWIEKPQLFSWVTLEVMISWYLANEVIYSASLNAASTVRDSVRDYSVPGRFLVNHVLFKCILDEERGL